MKAKEFLELIDSSKHADYWKETAYELCGSYHEIYEHELIAELKEKGYTLKSEDGYGGEGQGDSYWGVFSVTHNGETTYFKLSGWYASFNGAEVDYRDLTVVEKVPVQKYEWKKVK